MDYTQLIERLRAGTGGGSHWMELEAEGADAIEALQARVADAERMQKYYSDYCNLTAAERDAALAKLRELDSQEPVADVLMHDGEKIIDGSMAFMDTAWVGQQLYARPVPAQPTARTYMDGYSDCKAWALEQAQPEPVSRTNPDGTEKHPFALWSDYETKIEALTREVAFHKSLSAKAEQSPPVTQEITRLNSIIEDLKLAQPEPQPDCRTCDHKRGDHWGYDICSRSDCTNGDKYQPSKRLVLWRTE